MAIAQLKKKMISREDVEEFLAPYLKGAPLLSCELNLLHIFLTSGDMDKNLHVREWKDPETDEGPVPLPLPMVNYQATMQKARQAVMRNMSDRTQIGENLVNALASMPAPTEEQKAMEDEIIEEKKKIKAHAVTGKLKKMAHAMCVPQATLLDCDGVKEYLELNKPPAEGTQPPGF